MGVEYNSAVVPKEMCSWYQKKSKTLMIGALILIELFGAYLVSKELHSKCMELQGTCKGCRANAWSCMSHANIFLSC